MKLRSSLFSLSAILALNTFAAAQSVAAFVLDRSGSMTTIRASGNSRAVDTVIAAEADITDFFFWETLLGNNPKALVFEYHGSTITQLGGVHTSAATAIAEVTALPTPNTSWLTPMAAALCDATDALIALAPNLSANQRSIWIYSDGDENSSSPLSCKAGLPNATSGSRCIEQFGLVPPFSTGSWQEAVCSIIHEEITLNVYYFDQFSFVANPITFLTALTSMTGGSMYVLGDSSTAPPRNPWRTYGEGCSDFQGFKPSMRHDGVPQVGSSVGVGCRTNAPWPYMLVVGFQNTVGGIPMDIDLGPLGAPGCSAYSSSDLIEGVHAYDSLATIPIPASAGLVGTKISFQGVHMHSLNNPLGVATSNLLEMEIVQ